MTDLYRCKFCKKGFPSERVFMKHECTQMKRSKEIQTPEGAMAYGLYKRWLEKQRRVAPPIETFLTSAYFTAFMKFAEWSRETGIPDNDKYVEVMVTNTISPTNWRRTEAYSMFMEHMDKHTNPIDQAMSTAEVIAKLAELNEVEMHEVFALYKAGEIADLVNQKQMSPWLLFCSVKFKEWVAQLDEHDRKYFMNAININYWVVKLERAKPAMLNELKTIAQSLGI